MTSNVSHLERLTLMDTDSRVDHDASTLDFRDLGSELAAAFDQQPEEGSSLVELDPAFAGVESDGPSPPRSPVRQPKSRHGSVRKLEVDDEDFSATTTELIDSLASTDRFLHVLRALPFEDDSYIVRAVRTAQDFANRMEREVDAGAAMMLSNGMHANESESTSLLSLQALTTQLIASLGALHEHAQIQHASLAESGRRLRAIRQAVGTAQRDSDQLEHDRARLRDFYANPQSQSRHAREHCRGIEQLLDDAGRRASTLLIG